MGTAGDDFLRRSAAITTETRSDSRPRERDTARRGDEYFSGVSLGADAGVGVGGEVEV